MSSSDESSSIISNYLYPFLWKSGTVGIGLVAILAGVLYKKQNSLLYFPAIGGVPRRPGDNPRRYRNPKEYKIPYADHYIRCEDGVSIHAWWLTLPVDNAAADGNNNNAPTILFFHGNAGNIGLRLPNAYQMMYELKCNLVMVEYRGYGNSDDATVTEDGLKLDAEAALRYVLENSSSNSDVYIFGRSLGGAVAIHLAEYITTTNQSNNNNNRVKGIIVENTFLSISKMVDVVMPFWISALKSLVLRIDWDSERILSKNIPIPILFLAGRKDELVPHWHMKRLYELSSSQNYNKSKLYVIPDGTHNDTWLQGGALYWTHFKQFLQQTSSSSSSTFQKEQNQNMIGEGGTMMVDDSTSSMFRQRRNPSNKDEISPSTIGMGYDDDPQQKSSKNKSSSIPIMPTNLLGMAKEATMTSDNKKKNTKKKE